MRTSRRSGGGSSGHFYPLLFKSLSIETDSGDGPLQVVTYVLVKTTTALLKRTSFYNGATSVLHAKDHETL